MQYLVRSLFFSLVAFVLLATAILAFRNKRKDLQKKQYVEFSMVKESHYWSQWGAIVVCVFSAIACFVIAVDQAIKLIRLLLS